MRSDGWVPLPKAGDPRELEMLKAAYERVCKERDRLREARGFFARPLGPAPATAGISTALVAAFASGVHTVWIVFAAITVTLMIVVGIWYDSKPAYRHLYRKALDDGQDAGDAATEATPWDARTPGSETEWYRIMIAREVDLRGRPEPTNRLRAPWEEVDTLQDGLDSERTGLRAVQLLWLGALIFLLLAAN
jgi:hypothetical protein